MAKKPRTGKHRGGLNAERVRRAHRALEDAGAAGVSTLEFATRYALVDPKDAIYEARCNGIPIVSEREGKHKRYFMARFRPDLVEKERREAAASAGSAAA